MAGRKRGASLEERLAAIRTPEEVPAESTEAAVAPESTEAPEPDPSPAPFEARHPVESRDAHEAPESFYSFRSVATPPRAADASHAPDETRAVERPDAAISALLRTAAEGDTFLPGSAAAANRVDVGAAVQAAVSQLLPELEQAEPPTELATAPEDTPLLSKLLGRGWMSARRAHHEQPDEVEPEIEPQIEPEIEPEIEPQIDITARAEVDADVDVEAAPDVENEPDIDADAAPGELSEIDEIIAEIAEITEVAEAAESAESAEGERPREWVPVRGRVPKPRPFRRRQPDMPIVEELVEIEPIVNEIIEEPEPEPELDTDNEPIVEEIAAPEFEASEQSVIHEFVAKAEAAEAADSAEAEAEAAALNVHDVDDVDEGPIVGLVNALMGQAITDHASDLHIEPNSTHIAIRMRIDGVLHDSSNVPLELLRPVVSRVKILAGLDTAQNRLAQDGRFSRTIDGRSVDVRVVTMPTAAGEAVILRLLDPIRDALAVSSLGLSAEERARFIPAFTASQGAVVIAGPTGSGKTSTIYAVLSEVNTRAKSIVSVENPVEFRVEGIKQMQINARAGLTYATALPTVLRSDPDVVFIGEVRDTDTARIAADAAITGHLVLSTLHATRAASAPMRLVEMGVEPYLVASALALVASQRLARKLCEVCAEPADESTLDQLRGLGAADSQLHGASVRRAVGCPACRGTGYRGRLPIFEIMPVTEGISRLILERASRAQIEDLAVEEGMDTMLRAAIKRVVRGDLSVEEMLRVIS